MENSEIKSSGFFRNHADTLAIIAVNLGIAAILISICLSNISSIASVNARSDAANTRMDTLHTMFYELLKEGRK